MTTRDINFHKTPKSYRGRRSIRLKGYDYAQPGAYFITICTHHHENLLGTICQGEMQLSTHGKSVLTRWIDLPNHYSHIAVDQFVVMPNHVHGIIIILDEPVGTGSEPVGTGSEPVGTGSEPVPTAQTISKRHPLSEIVRSFKTFSARDINTSRNSPGIPVWQKNYYERIIRNEKELMHIRDYILYNPMTWEEDQKPVENL